MSASFRTKGIALRFAAGFGAVVVALSLIGAQLGLAHSYAGQALCAAALTASAQARLAAAQQAQERRAMR